MQTQRLGRASWGRGLALLAVACVVAAGCAGAPQRSDPHSVCFGDPERLSDALYRAINTARVASDRAPIEYRVDVAPGSEQADPRTASAPPGVLPPRPARNQLTVTYRPSGTVSSDPDCSALADAILSAMLQDTAHAANVLAPQVQAVEVVVQELPATDGERSFTVELLFDWH